MAGTVDILLVPPKQMRLSTLQGTTAQGVQGLGMTRDLSVEASMGIPGPFLGTLRKGRLPQGYRCGRGISDDPDRESAV